MLKRGALTVRLTDTEYPSQRSYLPEVIGCTPLEKSQTKPGEIKTTKADFVAFWTHFPSQTELPQEDRKERLRGKKTKQTNEEEKLCQILPASEQKGKSKRWSLGSNILISTGFEFK